MVSSGGFLLHLMVSTNLDTDVHSEPTSIISLHTDSDCGGNVHLKFLGCILTKCGNTHAHLKTNSQNFPPCTSLLLFACTCAPVACLSHCMKVHCMSFSSCTWLATSLYATTFFMLTKYPQYFGVSGPFSILADMYDEMLVNV